MIVERVEHPDWLSNAYLVADGPGGSGVLIDGNGLTESLQRRAEHDGITITHVLCTHGHADHVVDIEGLASRVGAPLVAHPTTDVKAQQRLTDGESIQSGDLWIRALYTPVTAPTTSPSSSTARTASPPTSSSRGPSAEPRARTATSWR